MAANAALPVLFTLLISLFPVALYCMVLASINRRAEPLMVNGAWDFAGVLFAVAGMALWAGPAMLSTLFERAVAGESARSFDELLRQWWLIWVAYYLLICAGAVLLLWLRRPTTAIYNVQPDLLPGLLAATLQRLGYDFAQNAHRQFLIAPTRCPAPTQELTAIAAASSSPIRMEPSEVEPYTAAVEIDQFESLSHATLHWYDTAPAVRREIEGELAKSLAGARPIENAAAPWQLGISILLFGAIFLSILFFILTGIFPRRW